MDPILFCLLKDISLFPHCQFFPLFWVIPVDIQISPIQNKTEQKRNKTQQSAWLRLPGQSLLHFLTYHYANILWNISLYFTFSTYAPLLRPLHSGFCLCHSSEGLTKVTKDLCVTKSNGQFSVHMFFHPAGAFDTIVSLWKILFTFGFHVSLLFCLSSYILGLLLNLLWGFFSTSWPLNVGGLRAQVFKTLLLLSISPKWFYLITHILQIHISTQKDSSVYPTV